MAILPIDLQTLYGSLDKVSKTAVQQQQGAHLQAVLNDEKEAHRQNEKKTAVVETEKAEEGPNINKDAHSHSGEMNHGNKKKDKSEELLIEKEIIKDPLLGKKIDISG